MLGLTGDDLSVTIVPDYVKIDVDGIEHLILKGYKFNFEGKRDTC